jgi:hypothetical protein
MSEGAACLLEHDCKLNKQQGGVEEVNGAALDGE